RGQVDQHARRSDLRLALAAARAGGSLCVRGREGEVCERLRGGMDQGDGPRSLRPRLISQGLGPTSCSFVSYVARKRFHHEGHEVTGPYPSTDQLSRIVRRSMTGAVSGRTPRHHWKASAACSTSMPTPSARRPAPADRATLRKGVSPFP